MDLKKFLFLVTYFADMKCVAKTTSLPLPFSVSDILFPNFHQHTNIRFAFYGREETKDNIETEKKLT